MINDIQWTILALMLIKHYLTKQSNVSRVQSPAQFVPDVVNVESLSPSDGHLATATNVQVREVT